MSRFDLVIRGGTVVTAADRLPADIGIIDGRPASPSSSCTWRAARRRSRSGGRSAAGFASTPRPAPQYLFLTEADIDKPDMEGAKCICAPPPGSAENQRAEHRRVSSIRMSDPGCI